MRTAAMVAVMVMTLARPGAGAAPAMTGYDARLRLPVCGPGELMRWQPPAGGWTCDGSELARLRSAYTASVATLVNTVTAMSVPTVPDCGGTDLPTLCQPPDTTPYCTAYPSDPACIPPVRPVVVPEGCQRGQTYDTSTRTCVTAPACSYEPSDQQAYSVCSPIWSSPSIGMPSGMDDDGNVITIPDDDSTNLMCRNAVWVLGASDASVLVGQVVTVVKTLTLPGGSYTLMTAADNHAIVSVDGVPVAVADCGPGGRCDQGLVTARETNLTLSNGAHRVTVTGYNGDDGSTWALNPAGFVLRLYDAMGGQVYTLRDGVDRFAACASGFHFDGGSLCVPDVAGSCPVH